MKKTAALLLGVLTAPFTVAACWTLQPGPTSVVFTGTQAGAPISGAFRQFQGTFHLAQADDGKSYLNVEIETASLDTRLPELDEVLRGPEFFDVKQWPRASFHSASITALDDQHYRAEGTLRIRDKLRPVTIKFQIEPQSGGRALTGRQTLQRLDYDIGIGEWRDTTWVGNEVTIEVNISLKQAPEPNCALPPD